MIGGCLGVYVVLAVAFHWFIQPSVGKRSPAPALSTPAAAPAAVARSDGAAPPPPPLVTLQAPARVQAPRSEAPAIAALPLGRSAPLEAAPSAGSVDIAEIAKAAVPAPSVAYPPTKPAPPARKIRRLSEEEGWFTRASRVY